MLGTGALGSSLTRCFGVHLLCFFTVNADDGLKEKMYFQRRLPSIGAFVAGPWYSHSACGAFPLRWLLKHTHAFLPLPLGSSSLAVLRRCPVPRLPRVPQHP